jgi:hypothetical protein
MKTLLATLLAAAVLLPGFAHAGTDCTTRKNAE